MEIMTKMKKLDLKDRKILYELDLNSRQSFHDIAKKVGLSKDAVIYRIEKLQKSGVIKRFQTIIDVGKLGYISFRLYLKFYNIKPEKEQEIINFLKKQKIIVWIASIEGDYDIALWILAKTIREMDDLWKLLLKKYTNYISKRFLTIFTRVVYFPRVHILNRKYNTEEFVFITHPQEIKLDKIDLEILKLLAKNSRTSIVEIARKLNVVPKTVISRIRNLERKKVILGYRTMFDLEKLGLQYYKIFISLKDVTEKREKEFRAYIKQHPNIIYDNEVLGGADFEVEAEVKDLIELRKIINEIKEEFFDIIKEYNYMLFYKEHKYVYLPI